MVSEQSDRATHGGMPGKAPRFDKGWAREESDDGAALLFEAQEVERSVSPEAVSPDGAEASANRGYEETLAAYVEVKREQAERIGERLELLIDRQQVALQEAESRAPGRLAFPGTQRAWSERQAKQRARLRTLHLRLDAVREIAEGIGQVGTKLEELGARRMREDHPALAAEWDRTQELARRDAAEARLGAAPRQARSASLMQTRAVPR